MSRLQMSKLTRVALRTVWAGGILFGADVLCIGNSANAQELAFQKPLPQKSLVQLSQPAATQTPSPIAAAPEMRPSDPGEPQEILRAGSLRIPNTSVVGVGTTQLPADSTQGRLPDPIPLPYGPDRQEGWVYSSKRWVPPVFCHQPTYYEDQMLENHGHERFPALQPMVSGARFYTGLFLTPYFYTIRGPFEDISSVGRYRPGSVAPALRQRPPYDPHAIGTQALSTGSGVLLLRP